MVLGFKKQFIEKIINGSKIHTIRLDPKNRWKVGNKIHFANGVRTKNYNQFKEGTCMYVQQILIDPIRQKILLGNDGKFFILNENRYLEFMNNDGFDSESEFWKWFDKPFHGKIIYWTNFNYN